MKKIKDINEYCRQMQLGRWQLQLMSEKETHSKINFLDTAIIDIGGQMKYFIY